EEHPLSADLAGITLKEVDLDSSFAHEASFAHDELNPCGLVPLEMKLSFTLDHCPLPGLDARHVGHRRLEVHPELARPRRERANLRRANDVLARQTGDIRTRAADQLPLHDCRTVALASHRPGQPLTCLATADDEDVVAVG